MLLPLEDPWIAAVPAEPGSYALVLHLEQPHNLQVGRLGTAWFQAGIYIYLGSAEGTGGLRARINRHVNITGVLYWHVDYLRRASRAIAIYCLAKAAFEHLPAAQKSAPLECCWSQSLANMKGGSYPMPGFGSSDCQMGCPAHLLRIESMPEYIPAYLAQAAGVDTHHFHSIML